MRWLTWDNPKVPWSEIPSPSKHPFQLWVMWALAVSGIGTLITVVGGIATPESIAVLLPLWARVAWAALVAITGPLALVAAYWHDRVTGLLLERAALAGICGAAIAYGLGIVYVAHWKGIIAGGLLVGIGVAAWRRAAHVTVQLQVLRVIAPPERDEPHGG